jgi:APA family basic amino acid/polyamine antiporter
MAAPTLKRSIGLGLLTLYGLGTILGAGIYVLIGEVARVAGTATPSAFLMAGVLAAFTAFSYAELSARLPRSAGEAAYVREGFASPRFAQLVGWAVVATGMVSAATIARGFVGYLAVFVPLPPVPVIFVLVLLLGGLAFWGINESLRTAALITGLEIAGLVLVCWAARGELGATGVTWAAFLPVTSGTTWAGVLAGAFVAFYAFIGFEDMVNVAEEVRRPERTLPAAILLALVISTTLYMLVAIVATLSVPLQRLAASDAPLAEVVAAGGYSPTVIALISMLAVVNGALIQIIMASRVLYGMAAQGLVWSPLGRVHRRTRTPHLATLAATAAVLALALVFPLETLARITSFIALAIFAAVHGALLSLKRRAEPSPFTVPAAVPQIGFLLCSAMLLYQMGQGLLQLAG